MSDSGEHSQSDPLEAGDLTDPNNTPKAGDSIEPNKKPEAEESTEADKKLEAGKEAYEADKHTSVRHRGPIGPLEGSLIKLGSVRDGLLILLSLVYALGYSVWAINAYSRNLGLLPALQFEYFIAGV